MSAPSRFNTQHNNRVNTTSHDLLDLLYNTERCVCCKSVVMKGCSVSNTLKCLILIFLTCWVYKTFICRVSSSLSPSWGALPLRAHCAFILAALARPWRHRTLSIQGLRGGRGDFHPPANHGPRSRQRSWGWRTTGFRWRTHTHTHTHACARTHTHVCTCILVRTLIDNTVPRSFT